MGGWSYYRLCGNLCGSLGSILGGNLGPFWAQKNFFFDNFYENFATYLGLGSCVI